MERRRLHKTRSIPSHLRHALAESSLKDAVFHHWDCDWPGIGTGHWDWTKTGTVTGLFLGCDCDWDCDWTVSDLRRE